MKTIFHINADNHCDKMLPIYVLLLLVCPLCAQVVFPGSCKNFTEHVEQDFDVERYMGLWYELESYRAIFQRGTDCIKANYSMSGENRIKVIKRAKYVRKNYARSAEGFAWQDSPENREGKLSVQFPNSPKRNYWVLGTDYDTYSVVWSCTDNLMNNSQLMWVLGRKAEISVDTKDKIDEIFKSAKIDKSRIFRSDPEICRTELKYL